jgi:hypothetical protein
VHPSLDYSWKKKREIRNDISFHNRKCKFDKKPWLKIVARGGFYPERVMFVLGIDFSYPAISSLFDFGTIIS